jgi:DNA-binding CsgD family transcriptional regulator
MQMRHWRLILGWGGLTAAVLGCLYVVSLAPPLWGWARELVGAAIAIVAIAVGAKLGAERRSGAPPGMGPAQGPAPLPAATPSAPQAPPEPLTTRELEVLRLLCRGAANKDIARALHLSENTVKTHLANLYAKLQVGKRTEAQAAAWRLGLVRPDENP